MKKLLMLLTCFVSLSLSAQEATAEQLEQGWQLLSQKDGVNLYAKKEACKVDPFKQNLIYVMIKVENTTQSEVSVNYGLSLNYDVGCYGCDGQNEANRTIAVPAGATLEGDCNFDLNELTYLISNPNHVDIREFEGVKLITLNID